MDTLWTQPFVLCREVNLFWRLILLLRGLEVILYKVVLLDFVIEMFVLFWSVGIYYFMLFLVLVSDMQSKWQLSNKLHAEWWFIASLLLKFLLCALLMLMIYQKVMQGQSPTA